MLTSNRGIQFLTVALAVAWLVGASPAQWTATNMHPDGAGSSYLYGTSGGQQVGLATLSFETAYLWRGTSASGVSLRPVGSIGGSRANGVGDGFQVGRVFANGIQNAAMWNGSTPWINLNPLNATESEVFAVSGGEQVGRARFNGGVADRASLWHGSADTWMDLSPPSSTASAIYGVHNGEQVGYAMISFAARAGTWHGNRASWVNIHPAGATGSVAWCVHQGRIAGTVSIGGITRAAVWSSSTSPWVDLNPLHSTGSRVQAVYRDVEVGYAFVGGTNRASVWHGTAASWEDLSTSLIGSWGQTVATGVWSDSTTTYVSGWGFNNATNRYEALLWTRANPPPTCVADVDDGTGTGTPDGGVTIDDLLYYLGLFAGGLARADVDDGTGTGTRDGGVTIDDLLYYLVRFEGGC